MSMSEDRKTDTRQTDDVRAIDQGTRAAQAEEHDQEPVASEDDYIETMRQRLAELEERDRAHEAEVAAERRRAAEDRRSREAAEQRAREADSRAAQAADTGRRTVDDARLGEITTSLGAHQGQMTSLKSQYKAAFAEGDGEKMADIQAEMALVGSRITTLEQGKTQLEARRAAPVETPSAAPSIDTQRQNYLQTLTPLERDWVSAHPEFFEDSAFQNKVAAAANDAMQFEGFARGSQRYIDHINHKMGFTTPAREAPNGAGSGGRSPDASAEAHSSATAADRRMIAAPAGGSVPNTSRATGGGDQPIYLTAGERRAAMESGVTEAEYAKAKRELTRENLIGPNANNRR